MDTRILSLLLIFSLLLIVKCSVREEVDRNQQIYQIVFDYLYPNKDQVILRDSTLTVAQNTHTWFYYELDKEFSESFADSLEEKFIIGNKIPMNFQIMNLGVRYLSLEEYFILIKNDKRNSFEVISSKFPGAKEYAAFSNIVFSKDKSLALLKVLRLTSDFEEYDHFFILRKKEGSWKIYKNQRFLNQGG